MSTTIRGHELAGEYAALDALLAESEGEWTEEIEQLWEELDLKAEDKIQKIALVILRWRNEAVAIEAEEKRLAARRRTKTRQAEHHMEYLDRVMQSIGKQRVSGVLATVWYQNNSKSVQVDEEKLTTDRLKAIHATVPQLVRHVEKWELDKRAALEAIEAGRCDLDGCTVVQTRSLRIR